MHIVVVPRATATLIPRAPRKAGAPTLGLSGVGPAHPDLKAAMATEGALMAIGILGLDRRPGLAAAKDDEATIVVEATRPAEDALKLEVAAITLRRATFRAPIPTRGGARPPVRRRRGDATAIATEARPRKAIAPIREAIHRRGPLTRPTRGVPA